MRYEYKDGEKLTRFSIRKYHFGAASVAVASLIFFGGGDYYDIIANSKKIDVAFKLKLETFKNRYMYKLQLEDIKNSMENTDFNDNYLELNGRDISFPIRTVVYPKRPDIDNPLNLVFNDYGLAITKDRTIIENIDVNLANILKVLKKCRYLLQKIIHLDLSNKKGWSDESLHPYVFTQ